MYNTRHFGNTNPHYNMNKNSLINQFQNHQNQQNNATYNPFINNQMINKNPNFSMSDPYFYQRVNMAKIDQIKRAKNIDDLGIKKDHLYSIIINPMKVQKETTDEMKNLLVERNSQYCIDVYKDGGYQGNAYLREIWKNRTNQPYKNLIKKDLFDNDTYNKYYKDSIFRRDVSNPNDLIVHTVVKEVDADIEALRSDLKKLNSELEKHDSELKSIYSISEEAKHKKKFEYAKKCYRLEYNPKDCDELKNMYKKEQQKINKDYKMLDEYIENLSAESGILSNEEIQKLRDELKDKFKKSNQQALEYDNGNNDGNNDGDNISDESDDELEELQKELERVKREEKKIRKELGKSNKPTLKITVSDLKKKPTVKLNISVEESKKTEKITDSTNIINANNDEDMLRQYYNNRDN